MCLVVSVLLFENYIFNHYMNLMWIIFQKNIKSFWSENIYFIISGCKSASIHNSLHNRCQKMNISKIVWKIIIFIFIKYRLNICCGTEVLCSAICTSTRQGYWKAGYLGAKSNSSISGRLSLSHWVTTHYKMCIRKQRFLDLVYRIIRRWSVSH